MAFDLQLLHNILENSELTVQICIIKGVPNLNSGMRQMLTSLLALVASMAMKPASRPINLTKPIP
jgi:hypothetical protein